MTAEEAPFRGCDLQDKIYFYENVAWTFNPISYVYEERI